MFFAQAITPPNALTPPSAQSCMPTAAAVAAAAATAKIQAMDAVANNALVSPCFRRCPAHYGLSVAQSAGTRDMTRQGSTWRNATLLAVCFWLLCGNQIGAHCLATMALEQNSRRNVEQTPVRPIPSFVVEERWDSHGVGGTLPYRVKLEDVPTH